MFLALILVTTTNAFHSHCKYEFVLPLTMTTVYGCLSTVTLTESTALESVTGGHKGERSNDDVEFFGMDLLENQFMPFFPQNLLNFFKNLKAISLSKTQLLTLSAMDLQPIPGLLFLYLGGNNLTSLDGDLLQFSPHIRLFSVENNQIEQIGPNFHAPEELQSLYLENNVCISINVFGRSQVQETAPKLSDMCSSFYLTTTATTVDFFNEVYEKIDKLQASNLVLETRVESLKSFNAKQTEEIDKLQKSLSAFEKRVSEIEKKLLITSTVSTTTIPTTDPTTSTSATNQPSTFTSSSRDVFSSLEELKSLNIALSLEIDVLQEFSDKHEVEIKKLTESISTFYKRMLEIEEQLGGSSAMPRLHWLSFLVPMVAALHKQLIR